jgi:hypothetical protein
MDGALEPQRWQDDEGRFDCLAERPWREFCPKLVAAMEAAGWMEAMILEAERP